MRRYGSAVRKLLIAAVAAITLAGACGGGDDDPTTDAAPDGSTTSTTAAGLGSTTSVPAPGDTTVDPNATTTTGAPATPDTTPIDAGTVETLPPAPDPGPSDPGFPPADPGQYAYQTTGTASGQPVNAATVTTVTSLGASEIRYAAADMVLDLQYRPDGVYLRQLVARLADQVTITFQSAEGVLFIPIPQDAGRTWNWSLPDTSGGLTAAWQGSTLPGETINAGGGQVATTVIDGTIAINGRATVPVLGSTPVAANVAIKLWIDPARRLPVQLHQVVRITEPVLAAGYGSDTTSTFTGFTPG